jgi:hypothetical protein
MLRQLFALLLLLTGLAALGQPAQARAYEAPGADLAAAACEYASPARADLGSALLSAPARAVGSRSAAPAASAASPMPVPTVIVQADRAHE